MCLFSTPQMPAQQPIPRTPQPDSEIATRQSDEARRLAAARGGSSANIISDLVPSQVASARPVLSPTKAVFLGQ